MQSLKAGKYNLTEKVVRTLAQNRISTVLDFLQEDNEKLATLTKLSLPEIFALRNDIFEEYSAPVVNGTSMLLKSLTTKRLLSTGIQSLDTLIGGGLSKGFITEILGLADSGKTQLCLQIAINTVRNTDATILYLDTKGDFSAIRVQKILDACGLSHKEMALIMYKIRVVHIWTMDEMLEFMKQLKSKVVVENLNMILLDSLPCLMFQYLGDDNKMGLTFLNLFVNYSRWLCKELDIVMLCVNIQTRWIDHDAFDVEDDGEQSTSGIEAAHVEKRNRCLGRYWQHIPAMVILLEKSQVKIDPKNNNSSLIEVKILKTNERKNSHKCTLSISNVGVT